MRKQGIERERARKRERMSEGPQNRVERREGDQGLYSYGTWRKTRV